MHYYIMTPKVGGKVDRLRLAQVTRALAELKISTPRPEGRDRMERVFRTLPQGLPPLLPVHGITTIAVANKYLRRIYIPDVIFSVERGYEEAQVIGMYMEGIDIAVLFPTAGLSVLARDNIDPQLSAVSCRIYNDWLHEL
jgi:hypothetical protein